MANALYDLGREGFLGADIDWDLDNIIAILIDTALYTVNLATDQFLSDIPVGARVATSANLTAKTKAAGIADAADVNFASVTGATVEALVLVQNTGVETTSRLIAFIDTATNLPFTPNGSPIDIAWDNAANKIFKL